MLRSKQGSVILSMQSFFSVKSRLSFARRKFRNSKTRKMKRPSKTESARGKPFLRRMMKMVSNLAMTRMTTMIQKTTGMLRMKTSSTTSSMTPKLIKLMKSFTYKSKLVYFNRKMMQSYKYSPQSTSNISDNSSARHKP